MGAAIGTGVAGAAVATVLSEAIAAIHCIIYAFRKVPQFGQAFVYRKLNKDLIRKTMQVALGAAIVTYTGQNMGAGKQDRISLGVIAAMKISAVVSELQACF